MTETEFHEAIEELRTHNGLKLPFDLTPGTAIDGNFPLNAKYLWDDYVWNPPEYLFTLPEYTTSDLLASPKPSWEMLEGALDKKRFREAKEEKLKELDEITTMRICQAYGCSNFNDELKLRLRGGQTQAQDDERDRLRAVYHVVKAQLKPLRMSEVKDFDLEAKSLWQ